MAVSRTTLSAGIMIRRILTENPDVSAITRKIFPVATDEAKLPYIMYRRSGFEQNPNKGIKPADTIYMEVLCLASSYEGSISLAEAVRSALDGVQYNQSDMNMRGCYLIDGEEVYQDDAFVQSLTFSIKI